MVRMQEIIVAKNVLGVREREEATLAELKQRRKSTETKMQRTQCRSTSNGRWTRRTVAQGGTACASDAHYAQARFKNLVLANSKILENYSNVGVPRHIF